MENSKDIVELVASSRKEDVEEAAEILKKEGIRFKTEFPARERISSQIVGETAGPKCFLSVNATDYLQAWEALEKAYLSHPIPEDYFLSNPTDDELIEILSAPNEWSPYNVAHARRIAKERELDPGDYKAVLQEAASQQIEDRKIRRQICLIIFIIVFILLVRGLLRSG